MVVQKHPPSDFRTVLDLNIACTKKNRYEFVWKLHKSFFSRAGFTEEDSGNFTHLDVGLQWVKRSDLGLTEPKK